MNDGVDNPDGTLSAPRDPLIELTPIGLFEADQHGACTYANPRACLLMGQSATSVLGDGWAERIDERDRQRVWDQWQTSVQTSERFQIEFRARGYDDVERWLRAEAVAVPGETDAPVRFVGSVVDISSYREIETDLRLAQRRLEDAQRVARIGSWEWEISPDSVIWSDHLFEVFGVTPDDFIPTYEGYVALVHPECREEVRHQVDQSAKTGGGLDYRTRIVRPSDGATRTVHILGAVERDANGAPIRIVGTARDVTEETAAAEEILRYQRQLQDLAADLVSARESERHRIAQGLHDDIGQILIGAGFKLAALKREAKESQWADEIDVVAALLGDATDKIRALVFELGASVVRELGLERALRRLANKKGKAYSLSVTVEGTLGDHAIPEAHALTLYRAVGELITNVAKHAQSSHAKLRLRGSPRTIGVEVCDEGVGFPKERSTIGEGVTAGFGLLHIREQLTRVGGECVVETQPGRGTTVALRLPLGHMARR